MINKRYSMGILSVVMLFLVWIFPIKVSAMTELDVISLQEEEELDLVVEITEMPTVPFVEVDKSAWYYDAIEYVNNFGFMTGTTKTTFEPASNLARAQFALIIYRMSREPDVSYSPVFGDVTREWWFAKAVTWANKAGVINGYENGLFGPCDPITREQMATMMYRYAKYRGFSTSGSVNLTNYYDARYVSTFAKEAMQWAVGNGIITGEKNGTALNPQGYTTRSQAAVIISRFCKKYMSTAEQTWHFFRSQGYTKVATSAIMGNAKIESYMNTSTLQGGTGPGAGLMQWEGYPNGGKDTRWGQLNAMAKSRGVDWTDLHTQLLFITKEIDGMFRAYTGSTYTYANGTVTWWPTKMTVDEFKVQTSIKTATEIFERVYLRPSIPHRDWRYDAAMAYYNTYK